MNMRMCSHLIAEIERERQRILPKITKLVKKAGSKGIKLDDYVLSTAQFDARKGVWQLFYYHKPPGVPGGHFTIYVNDETKATQFIGAR